MVERRIRMAKFPAVKSLRFDQLRHLEDRLLAQSHAIAQQDDGSGLARCEYIERRKTCILAIDGMPSACPYRPRPRSWRLVRKASEPRLSSRRRLWSIASSRRKGIGGQGSYQRDSPCCGSRSSLAKSKLHSTIDELGFVPLSKTGAELLFEVFSHGRYEGELHPGGRQETIGSNLQLALAPIEPLARSYGNGGELVHGAADCLAAGGAKLCHLSPSRRWGGRGHAYRGTVSEGPSCLPGRDERACGGAASYRRSIVAFWRHLRSRLTSYDTRLATDGRSPFLGRGFLADGIWINPSFGKFRIVPRHR